MIHWVAIVGSRRYADLDGVRRFVVELPTDTWIVSGGALGVDRVAVEAARARGLRYVVYKPDYEHYGREAPLIRNGHIVQQANEVIAFWDGASPGTRDTIKKARRAGKPVRVCINGIWQAEQEVMA